MSAAAISQRTYTLPLFDLLAFSMATFLILMEAPPTVLLPPIGTDLGVSAAIAGLLITITAIGSFLVAISLAAAARIWRRWPMLLSAIIGFVAANTVSVIVDSCVIVLVARVVGRGSAGQPTH